MHQYNNRILISINFTCVPDFYNKTGQTQIIFYFIRKN